MKNNQQKVKYFAFMLYLDNKYYYIYLKEFILKICFQYRVYIIIYIYM